MILKYKMALQLYMESKGFLPEEKHLLGQLWTDLWYLLGKDTKLWLIEVTVAI